MRAAILLGAVAVLATAQGQVAEPDPFAGRFQGDGATLEMTANGGAYSGTLALGGGHYLATMRVSGTVGSGSYEVSGQAQRFTLTREANGLMLETAGSGYRLTRRAPDAATAPEDAQATAGLVGTWRNETSSAQFNSDGTGVVNGAPGRYEVRGNRVTLTGATAQTVIRFEVHGDILALTVNGKPVTLNRVRDAGGEGEVRVELVGRWCLISLTAPNAGGRPSKRCLTLNGNGTYDFAGQDDGKGGLAAESGLWTATESTLTTHARNGKGTTYQMAKRNHPGKVHDPMIMLDGQAYVSFFNKAPW